MSSVPESASGSVSGSVSELQGRMLPVPVSVYPLPALPYIHDRAGR